MQLMIDPNANVDGSCLTPNCSDDQTSISLVVDAGSYLIVSWKIEE